MATELRSYIDGNWHEGARLVDDINPANPSEAVAQVSMGNTSVAVAAVEAASAAFVGWRRTPAPARGEILRKAADLLEQRASTVGRDLTREEGKTLVEGIGETKRAAAILRYYAGLTLEADGQTYPSLSPKTFLFARREPIGVVAAITPWNFPIAIPAWKIAPALAYGNTVVWKPAELVPLTATHLLQALVDAGLPKVGRSIQRKATEHGKKVQLEMGGKNPSVVLADANLDHAAEQVARGAFLSAGQKCTATSRVIVEEPVLREFQDRLTALAKAWKLGDPLEEDTKVGPVVSRDQMQTVLDYIQIGSQEGGRVLTGGEKAKDLGDGYYVQPTIITDLSRESRVAREEIFGPVVAILPARSYEEAVALANDTPFGLTASLFTNDLTKALRFANDIRVGVVKINQESAGLEFQVPFGGAKESSSGSREQGEAAKEFFTQWKTVYMDQV
ncbi:MAG: aldehyde dehydrogenase family protein [Chloroflexi bacterium]|nr:MAG: aldehyde dehydrogenase family protein [Chloroflexota bacterium]